MLSNETDMGTKLQRIADKASQDKACRFTSLFHLMNKPYLLECSERLKGNAASGIDNITPNQGEPIVQFEVKCVIEEPCA